MRNEEGSGDSEVGGALWYLQPESAAVAAHIRFWERGELVVDVDALGTYRLSCSGCEGSSGYRALIRYHRPETAFNVLKAVLWDAAHYGGYGYIADGWHVVAGGPWLDWREHGRHRGWTLRTTTARALLMLDREWRRTQSW